MGDMPSTPRRGTYDFAFLLNILAGVLIAIAFVTIAVTSIYSRHQKLEESAALTALRWSEVLDDQPERLTPVLDGERIGYAEMLFFETLAHISNIHRYKIYDSNGRVLLSSDKLHRVGMVLTDEPRLPEGFAETLTEMAITMTRSDGTDDPRVYADVFFPVTASNGATGVLEVLVDQSEEQAIYREEMIRAIGLAAGLALIGFLTTGATAVLLRRKRKSDALIQRMAHYDALTGTANRREFVHLLEERLRPEAPGAGMVALHAVDVDCFKLINDTLGHDVGDAVLVKFSQSLQRCLGRDEVLARLGGDEFAVIQTKVANPAQTLELADAMIQATRSIREALGVPLTVSASIGIAVAPVHADNAVDLQKCADVALYKAKTCGRDRRMLFADGMDGALRERTRLRMLLRTASARDAFELHYQPLHRAQDGSLCAFEGLLRLQDGEGGFVSPGDFVPVAEEMGMMPRIGAWVLQRACLDAAQWPPEVGISVNLSPQQFNEDVVSVVSSALAMSGLAPHRLELEVTESLFIHNAAKVGEQLSELKALGVGIAMDDFGTGYSSLSYLWMFPFDKLKVDRSFFRDIEESQEQREVLRTIIAMSQAMSLDVTAEGIETEVQRDFACNAGYNELQGFLYHRPMPLTDVADYIQSKSATHAANATGTAWISEPLAS